MKIQHILDTKAALDSMVQEAVDSYLTHKDIPLDERWELYKQINMLLPVASWTGNNAIEKAVDGVCLYDDFNIERYQTVRYVDHVEWLEDDLAYAADLKNITYAEPREPYESNVTHAQVNLIKEYALASGTQGFVNDW